MGQIRSVKWVLGPLSRGLGIAIAAAGTVLVSVAVARRWDEIQDGVGSMHPGLLLLAVASAAAGMVAIALAWRAALAIFGTELTRSATLRAYFRGEVGKYIPGSVWSVVGRAELATRAGARRSDAYCSVLLGLAALYSGAAVVSVAAVASGVVGDPRIRIGALLGLSLGAGLLMNGAVWNAVSNGLRHMSKGAVWLPSRSQFLVLVALSLPVWLLIGTATWILTRSVWPEAPFSTVLLATAASWLGGFLAVPVPGGLGVREWLFVALLAAAPVGAAPAAAVLARLVFMLVDGSGALLASIPSSAGAPKRLSG